VRRRRQARCVAVVRRWRAARCQHAWRATRRRRPLPARRRGESARARRSAVEPLVGGTDPEPACKRRVIAHWGCTEGCTLRTRLTRERLANALDESVETLRRALGLERRMRPSCTKNSRNLLCGTDGPLPQLDEEEDVQPQRDRRERWTVSYRSTNLSSVRFSLRAT
jgi:hypothetical protein